jgi:hypothetical protein
VSRLPNEIGFTYWEGIVRIDKSFDNYSSSVTDSGDYKTIRVQDVNFTHRGYGSWDGIDDLKIRHWSFSRSHYSPIYIWIKGKEIHQFMKCKAVDVVNKIEKTKGLIRRQTYFEERFQSKGFLLEPSSDNIEECPCLAAYQGRIGGDNYIRIHQKGLVSFYTGSRSAETDDAARQSVTVVFIASNERPFMSTVRQKGKTFNVVFDSNGLQRKSADIGDDSGTSKNKINNVPLTVLKLRLAKGEITKEEFEELRKILE